MKVFRKISAMALALCMVLTSIALPVFAEGESIIGDSNIYRAPVGKVQEIEYSLEDSNGDEISGAEWSVSDFEGVTIDQNGILSVDGSVTAGDIVVTATVDGAILAEKTVTILEKTEQYSDLDRYYEDFEVYKDDETIVMKESPNRSSIKYSDPSGTGLIAGKEENGNTYAKATGLCYWGGKATFMIEPTKDGGKTYLPDVDVETIDARFMIENATADYQSLMWFESAGLRLGYVASAETGKANIWDRVALTKIATVNTNEWFDLRVEFDHTTSTYDVYLNNIRIIDGNTLTNDAYIGLSGNPGLFYIGASVDDLAIYNGRCAGGITSGAIDGDTNIYRAPIGKVQEIEYSLTDSNGDEIFGAEWSVSDFEGVTIDQNGILSVDGSVAAGDIVVTAAVGGITLAEKTVTILEKPEQYSDLFDRYYEDFEVYKDDETIVMKPSPDSSSFKYAAQIGTTLVTGKEENGNTYAKATGAYYWGDLATFELYNSYNPSAPIYMNGSNVVTFEGRFKAESAKDTEQALMFFDNAGLKLMYKAATEEGKANIYDYATSSNTVIATVDTDDWFDLRVEFNHIASTYDVYLNNVRIITENVLNNNLYIGAGIRGNALFIGASVDDLAMYNGRSANSITSGTITGDASIYRAPVGKVQEIEYSLVDLDGGEISGAEWTVGEYAGVTIDSNGVLSVDGSIATAGDIVITATIGGITLAEKTVTILAKPEKYSDLFDRYYEDFEVYKDDETIVMKASPNRSSIKYSDPSGTGLIVGKETNGNTYAKATGLCYWGDEGKATFMIEPTKDDGKTYLPDVDVETIDARFMIEDAKAGYQSLMWFENAGLKLGYRVAAETGKAEVWDREALEKIATVNTNEWFDLRVELDHTTATYDVYLNNIKIIDGNTLKDNVYIGHSSSNMGLFYIGASFDDLAIYNGRSAAIFETISITGDENIYRAPVGTTQRIVYTASTELPQGTEWSLGNAPEGVTIDQNGVLRVPGSAEAKAFDVQLVNSGQIVGSKTVTILSQPEQYSDAPKAGRYFEDFTRYEGAVIRTVNGLRGDIKLQSTELVATTEENGNVYAKAYISEGASWSTSTKAVKLVQSYNAGNIYMPDTSNVVIEGKFKVEMPTSGARWPMMWHLATGINISYEYYAGDDYAKIVYTDDSIAAGDTGNDNATIVANVLANEWFNLRLELDYENYTYSVFVEDVRVIKDKALKTNARINKDLTIAASVDDLAMYNGTKDASAVDEKAVIIKNGDAVDGETRRFDFASDGEVSLLIDKTIKNESDESKQITMYAAVYSSDGSLKECVYNSNLIMKDIAGNLFVELNCDVEAGDYAKIFVWSAGSIKPLE